MIIPNKLSNRSLDRTLSIFKICQLSAKHFKKQCRTKDQGFDLFLGPLNLLNL